MNRRITVQDGAATRDRELSGPTEGATATDLPAAIGQENAATAAGETPAQHGTSRLSPKPDSRPGPAAKDEQMTNPPRPHTRNPRPQPPAPIGRAGNRTRREHRDRETSPRPTGRTQPPATGRQDGIPHLPNQICGLAAGGQRQPAHSEPGGASKMGALNDE